MGIYRGPGGTGDATNDAASEATLVSQLVTQAQTSEANAASSATSAGTSATNASNSATSASTSATNAASSAASALSSKNSAATSEANALTYKNAAATSATNAATSATNAASSASSASTSASTATTQATNASSSASSASTSATNAATSATNAAASATSASNSSATSSYYASYSAARAVEAATSATNAASSASTATTQASTATTQATNASNSATAASTSATNAATSASTATTQAGIATTQATNASNSATSAANAQSAAETARDQTLAAFDSFDDRYLGQKATAPTVDNDGNALVAGALYFNTTTNEMKVYDGTQWLNAYASLSGALLATSNLSDLNNVVTARSNLGLGTAATTAATDYATAAQGTKADNALTTANPNYTGTLTGGTGVVNLGSGQFYKDASGNVGIGVTSVGAKLEVAGQVLGGGASGAQFLGRNVTYLGSNVYFATQGDNVQRIQVGHYDSSTLSFPTGQVASQVLAGVSTLELASRDIASSAILFRTGTGVPERMRIDANGNVGIGTTSSAGKLNISSSVGSGIGTNQNTVNIISTATAGVGIGSMLSFSGNTGNTTAVYGFGGIAGFKESATAGNYAGSLAFYTQNSGGGIAYVEQMRITSAGNVGIGTSSPSSKTEIAVVSVGSLASVLTLTNNTNFAAGRGSAVSFKIGLDSPVTTTFTSALIGSVNEGSTGGGDGGLVFQTADNQVLAERMRIDSSGNVGIGTASPSTYGKFVVDTTGATAVVFGDLVTPANETTLFLRSSLATIATAAAGAFRITTGFSGTERMRIDSSGRVLIGTSTAPSGGSATQVISSGNGGLQVNSTSQTAGFLLSSAVTGGGLAINTYTGAIGSETYTERMRITSAGNVGIGTTATESRFNLRGGALPTSSSSGLTFSEGLTAGRFASASTVAVINQYIDTSVLELSSGTTAGFYSAIAIAARSATVDPGTIKFATYGTERMRIDSAGNVGIGTTTPGTSSSQGKLAIISNGVGVGITTATESGAGYHFATYNSNVATPALQYFVANSLGDVNFGNARGALKFYANDTTTERMRIDSSGNVLVGTTSAISSGKLTVDGNVISNFDKVIGLSYFPDPTAYYKGMTGLSIKDSTARGLHIFNYDAESNQGINFYPNNRAGQTGITPAVKIDSSGNVLIGRTTTPTNFGLLNVNGNIAFGTQSKGRIYTDANWGILFTADRASPTVAEFMWETSTGTERMRIDTSGNLLFNSGYGSAAKAYGCRAWVRFNGTGTVTILGSGNVSSITDNGVGLYSVNFTTAMPDVNYSAVNSAGNSTADGIQGSARTGNFLVGSVDLGLTNYAGTAYIDSSISVSVFR